MAVPKQTAPNMELRALLAVVLSLVVLTVYQYYFAEPPQMQPTATGAPRAETVVEPMAPQSDVEVERKADLGPATEISAEIVVAEAEDELVITSRGLKAVMTNRGAKLRSLQLKDYRSDLGGPLEFVRSEYAQQDMLPFDLLTPERPEMAMAANQGLYEMTVSGGQRVATPAGRQPTDTSPVRVRFRWADGAGGRVDKTFEFPADGYQIFLEVKATWPANQPVFLALGPGLVDGLESGSGRFLPRGPALLSRGNVQAGSMTGSPLEVFSTGELINWSYDDLQTPILLSGDISWAALESDYFTTAFLIAGPADVFLSPQPAPVAAGVLAEDQDIGHGRTALRVPPEGLSLPVFLGPRKYDLLQQQGFGLEQAIDFGFFGFLGRPLLVVLVWIYGYVGNYGVAIILLTVLVKLLFLPLSHKSMVSMRRAQKLQPQMTAIRARYKGVKDVQKRQQMNEEVMAVYKKEGVSPLGGCLPMLVQMPVLFALYSLLSVAIEMRHAPFALWVQDLSKHDPYLVLPLLMGATMVYQTRMTPIADPTQARISRMMPIMFTVFFLYVPSGLVLYWLVNNLLGIVQQVYVNRALGTGETKKNAPTRGKKHQRGKR